MARLVDASSKRARHVCCQKDLWLGGQPPTFSVGNALPPYSRLLGTVADVLPQDDRRGHVSDGGKAMYRCEATSVGGFVQQLAVGYITRGYRSYATGWVPERKDPKDVDAKLIARYGIDVSSSERSRRKQRGQANVQYIRHGRFFVLIATKGENPFYRHEAGNIRDACRSPILFEGYSIGFRSGHASVRLSKKTYMREKAYLEELATRRRLETLSHEFRRLWRFEPYAPVRQQFLNILRAVNRRRKTAGYIELPVNVLRMRRRIYRPFEPVEELAGEPSRVRTAALSKTVECCPGCGDLPAVGEVPTGFAA